MIWENLNRYVYTSRHALKEKDAEDHVRRGGLIRCKMGKSYGSRDLVITTSEYEWTPEQQYKEDELLAPARTIVVELD